MFQRESLNNLFGKNFLLLASIALLASFYLFEFSISGSKSNEKIVHDIENQISSQKTVLANTSQILSEKFSPNSLLNWEEIDQIFKENKINGYVYFNDSLIYWNAFQDDFYPNDLVNCIVDSIIQRNSEWYLVNINHCREVKITLFSNIGNLISRENPKLQNDFTLTSDVTNADFILKINQKNTFAGIIFNSNLSIGFWHTLLLFAFYIGFLICLIIWIFTLYKRFYIFNNSTLLIFIFFIIDVFIIRALDYYFVFASTLKQSFLFLEPVSKVFLFKTIGDILINGFLILTCIFIFYFTLIKDKIWELSYHKRSITGLLSSSLLFLFSFGIGWLINNTIKELEYDSLLGLDFYTVKGLSSIFILILYNAILFVMFKSLEEILSRIKLPVYIALIPIIPLVFLFYLIDYPNSQIIFLTAGLLILLILMIRIFKEKQYINIVKQLIYIILFGAFSALIINTNIQQKKDEHQKISAGLLTKENDFEFETLFKEAYLDIVQDSLFGKIIDQKLSEDAVLNYLKLNYFHQLTERFNIQLVVCSKGELLKIQPGGYLSECTEYFDQLISNSGNAIFDSTLFLLNGEEESLYYIGKIVLPSSEENLHPETAYLEFFSSIIPEGFGYTELLIDTKSDSVDLTGYSFAWYQDEQLIYKFGNFPYQTSFDFLKKFENEVFFELMGYRNFKIQISQDKYFIISRPSLQVTEQLVTFSILFMVLGSIMLFAYLIIFWHQAKLIFTLNFRIRLQFLFISTISLIIILFAIITFYYLESNNATRLKTDLNEKTQSVIIELQHKLSGNQNNNEFESENLYQMLNKFSLVFFSDINLYDLSGKLVASSRPEIFVRGLQSTQINPNAFNELNSKNQLYYLTEEKIGSISYYSSYAPLFIDDNQLVGYVNLPYFARQFDVERSYFLMFSTFINLFVILGILGTLLALFLSKILIKPLVVLQKSLATIQIEKPNTKIEWNIDDEIGTLIKEYNKMIDKLEQSTIMLKQSERESAWREVARQIAHEIKNPLTPMKLNVQYLERAYLENDPKFDEKMQNISASLVKQIDTLDKVAEMFSDFAKTKRENFEKVNLSDIVQSSASLFHNNSSVKIEIISEENKRDYFILAFEKDILRVFNNLLKNATQSLEGKQFGKVEIVFKSDENQIVVQVIDNGKGIKDKEKSKIFQPYFTTKTGGTGLGLAIVKNIMAEIGGEISFKSSPEKGTCFILKFNQFNKNSA